MLEDVVFDRIVAGGLISTFFGLEASPGRISVSNSVIASVSFRRHSVIAHACKVEKTLPAGM